MGNANPHPLWRQKACEWCAKGATRRYSDASIPYHRVDWVSYVCTAPTEAEYIAQLEAKIAELEKDKARMDKIISLLSEKDYEDHWFMFTDRNGWHLYKAGTAQFTGNTPRAAIDAAMNQTAQEQKQ